MKKDDSKSPWSAMGFAWELGYSIAIPLVAITLVGRLLDKKLGTTPWLLLMGLLISIAVTFFIVYKKLIALIREQDALEEEKNKKEDGGIKKY